MGSQARLYSGSVNYSTEMYPPSYNPSKAYPASTEPYQFDYSQAPPSYSELPSTGRNFGAFSKEMEGGIPSSQFNYARGFAQTPYSGFYSDPSFGTFISQM